MKWNSGIGVVLTIVAACLFGTVAHAQNSALPGPSPYALPGNGPVSAPAPQPQAGVPLPTAGIVDENYRLGTGDKMRITVYDEVDLSGEFLVDSAGQVQFPLVGQVNAAGLTVHEFVSQLTTTLGAKYLKDPKVSVEIENYRPFYIMGEVNKPGEYPYEAGLSVTGAVALAGGYTYRANNSDVYIRRNGSATESGMPVSGDIKIFPGDVVRIPERFF